MVRIQQHGQLAQKASTALTQMNTHSNTRHYYHTNSCNTSMKGGGGKCGSFPRASAAIRKESARKRGAVFSLTPSAVHDLNAMTLSSSKYCQPPADKGLEAA